MTKTYFKASFGGRPRLVPIKLATQEFLDAYDKINNSHLTIDLSKEEEKALRNVLLDLNTWVL